MTEEGGFVAVGSLTIDTGHAGDKMGALPAISHYDNTGTTVAYVTVGEDKHGIWVAGTLRADATPEQVRALRAAPMSGDWRKVGAGMELVAVLRSEEHTSELQSLMRISYAVFCLKKKK